MKERPILFSGPMVRAILEGRKTQTRRIIKPEWSRCLDLEHDDEDRENARLWCKYGVPGDQLWVKETWQRVSDCPELPCCEDGEETHRRLVFRATEPYGLDGYVRSEEDDSRAAIWRPSIFMPRKHSRITLEVTGVRVERLQDISEEDAKAEAPPFDNGPTAPRDMFCDLWTGINGSGSWKANPWVWVVEFKHLEAKAVAA